MPASVSVDRSMKFHFKRSSPGLYCLVPFKPFFYGPGAERASDRQKGKHIAHNYFIV